MYTLNNESYKYFTLLLGSTNIGAIVGGVLGGFSLAVIIIVLGALLCLVVTKWKQKKQRSLQPRTHQQPRSWLVVSLDA